MYIRLRSEFFILMYIITSEFFHVLHSLVAGRFPCRDKGQNSLLETLMSQAFGRHPWEILVRSSFAQGTCHTWICPQT